MPTTYPNQKLVTIHKEELQRGFLGINNGVWKAASRDLGAHAFRLYLYFAANAKNYQFAFSPAAVYEEIGMPVSTCRDQIRKLEQKGYLVHSHGNSYDFYEKPIDVEKKEIETASAVNSDQMCAPAANCQTATVEGLMAEGREINNKDSWIDMKPINMNNPLGIVFEENGFVF